MFRINILKNVFREHRPLNKKTKKRHFNIFKFHMMSHFRKNIKLYNVIDNFNTKHIKSRHMKVKKHFDQINKRNIWPHQIMNHEIRHINMLVMKDRILIENTKRTVLKSNQTKFIVTIFIRALNLKQVLKNIIDSQRYEIKKKECNITKYCSISYFVKTFKCDDLMKIFVVFVRQCRWKNDDINKNDREIYRLKKDFFWVNQLTMCVYDALSCWKIDDKIDNNFEELIKKYVRCAFNW